MFVQQLTLAAAILIFHFSAIRLPNRVELGPRTAAIQFEAVRLDPEGFAPLRLVGAWRVTSDDRRFGGISALAIDGGDFVALSDSGVLVRFPRRIGPSRALVREIPGGPGDPRFKSRRDSEALLRDPLGRGWWVAFENANALWLYDAALERALGHVDFGSRRWPVNRGIEGLSSDHDAVLAFPEQGDKIICVKGSSARSLSVWGGRGRISDAVRLPGGQLLVVNRNLSPLGFSNRLTLLGRTADGYRAGASIRLGVARLDNVEAIAAERLPNGTRLWLMTDDNLQRPMRTLLVALDWPEGP